jgi:hypothetical protein
MSFKDKISGVSGLGEEPESKTELEAKLEPELESEMVQALTEFRSSVHAWSESVYSRPRVAVAATGRRLWLAAECALCCLLVAGVSGGVYQRHHRQPVAQSAQPSLAKAAQPEAVVRSPQARPEDEDLLAKVDSDVSQQVPSAMQPLAQLMADDDSR